MSIHEMSFWDANFLSAARECIEAQGGTLALASHPKLPICFRLTCPER